MSTFGENLQRRLAALAGQTPAMPTQTHYTWDVPSSDGRTTYRVSSRHWTCECKAWSFGKSCRHITECKAQVDSGAAAAAQVQKAEPVHVVAEPSLYEQWWAARRSAPTRRDDLNFRNAPAPAGVVSTEEQAIEVLKSARPGLVEIVLVAGEVAARSVRRPQWGDDEVEGILVSAGELREWVQERVWDVILHESATPEQAWSAAATELLTAARWAVAA